MSAPVIDLTDPVPSRIVIGVGTRRGVSMANLRTAIAECLAASGCRTRDITAIVTVDGKASEPALLELSDLLSVPLSSLPADHLAQQQVPNPSAVTERAVGTPSVAEAAVLATGAQLIAPKHVGKGVTVALGILPPDPAANTAANAGSNSEPTTRAMLLLPFAHDDTVDLDHHGDAETAPGLVDLAVNVRPGGPPPWLALRLEAALSQIAAYPDQNQAITAVATRHQRPIDQVLLTAGGAEAFVLLARALQPRYAVVIHPQFTEPEAALLAAGHDVHRLVLEPPFTLAGVQLPPEADLVIVGNPTNPTSVLHAPGDLLALAKPGRVLVVDEAFMDAVTGQGYSLAGGDGGPPPPVPGLVVIRSLTKTWALAGLRVGYMVGDADVLAELGSCQPLWPVSTIALEAISACSSPGAVREAADLARQIAADREYLVAELSKVPGVQVVPDQRAPFVLFKVSQVLANADIHAQLRTAGWAVRRADTFPGLGPGWLRVAVRDRNTTDKFIGALAEIHRPERAPDTARPLDNDGEPMESR